MNVCKIINVDVEPSRSFTLEIVATRHLSGGIVVCMPELPPILVAELFPLLDDKLIKLLQALTAEEWHKPTSCSGWTVKDIAAHLLDGTLRRLALARDGFTGEHPPLGASYQDLVRFLDGLNADWIKAAKRLSPRILCDQLATSCAELSAFFISLEPHSVALFPVAWAGEEQSANWFDIAREYTEKWHHQQQIREAVNKPGIMTRQLYFPVLDTFMRALPKTFSKVAAAEGTELQIRVRGEAGGDWFLRRSGTAWLLQKERSGENLTAQVTLEEDMAWKLFTKGLKGEADKRRIEIAGNKDLASAIFHATAVMG